MTGGGSDARRPRRGEILAALLLTLAIAALAAIRATEAGGLWRDEAGEARLATLPTVSEVVASFQHEAFPPPFPLAVRAYSRWTGGGDGALRAFGFAVVLAIAGALWLDARLTARSVPILSLALLGFDAPFFVLGESLRGYGLGSALVLATYGLLAASLAEPVRAGTRPTRRQAALGGLAALAAVASVQVVLGNAALVLALCGAAAVVAAARRRLGLAAWALACGGSAALSLLPYAAQLAAARRQWSMIVVYPARTSRIWQTLTHLLGSLPVRLVWLVLALCGLAAAVRALARRRPAEEPLRGDPEARRLDVAAFAALAFLGALAAQIGFLELLAYTPRPWYLLPLAALLAAALDTLFSTLPARDGRRLAAARPAAAALVVLLQAAALGQGLAVRQTNVDEVARAVERQAAPQDLVVVVPWYFGVSFGRYYRGAAPWTTLPEIADHRIHRYDLLKARLASTHPLDDLLQATAATLASGHRVWLVGTALWPRPGEAVEARPPAPGTPDGWHDWPYLIAWSRQLGAFLLAHGGRPAAVPLPRDRPVNRLEDLSLTVVQSAGAGRPG